MTHGPQKTSHSAAVPDADDKPDDLSDAEWAAIQEARADLAAGRYYTQEEIVRWLRSWGTGDETNGPE